MGKIYCMMGKSSTGKDTLYKRLLEHRELSLKTLIPYTTRPIRDGETDGVEYFFCDEAKLQELEQQGRIVELRTYNTVCGIWKYFTVDDGQVRLEKDSYLVIGTLEAYQGIRAYYGAANVVPVYIEVEDGERLFRALSRERAQEHPKYEEMCRRFLADSEDFSEEKLREAGIGQRFENQELAVTEQELVAYILECEHQNGAAYGRI